MSRFQGKFFPSTKVSNWSSGAFGSGDAAVPITATGGTTNTYEGYKSHKFTSSGTFTVTDGAGEVEVMIIAGGGGAGNKDNAEECGGGGGAGGMTIGSLYCEAGTYVVTVGAGGAIGAPTGSGSHPPTGMPTSGSDSRVGIAFAMGGGRSGQTNQQTVDINGDKPVDGAVGGSGGGASGSINSGAGGAGGAAIAGQGYAGGSAGGRGGSYFVAYSKGGGGGAGAVGQSTAAPSNISVPTGYGGNGGAGATNDYETGSNQTYCGGGGGCAAGLDSARCVPGTGGSGGGGSGGTHHTGTRTNAVSGTANTGSGGGGGAESDGSGVAGAGGSGIVVIRYAA